MKYTYRLTQRHIDAAVAAAAAIINWQPEYQICPVAQVLREQVHPEIIVMTKSVELPECGVVARLSKGAQRITGLYRSAWRDLKPGTFSLEEEE